MAEEKKPDQTAQERANQDARLRAIRRTVDREDGRYLLPNLIEETARIHKVDPTKKH